MSTTPQRRELSSFEVLSFDCKGTLIDWEAGLWNALRPLLAGATIDRTEALTVYAAVESELQTNKPGVRYTELSRWFTASSLDGSGCHRPRTPTWRSPTASRTGRPSPTHQRHWLHSERGTGW